MIFELSNWSVYEIMKSDIWNHILSNKKNVQIVFNQMVLKQPKMEKIFSALVLIVGKEKQHLQRLVAVLLEEVLRELWMRAANNR